MCIKRNHHSSLATPCGAGCDTDEEVVGGVVRNDTTASSNRTVDLFVAHCLRKVSFVDQGHYLSIIYDQ